MSHVAQEYRCFLREVQQQLRAMEPTGCPCRQCTQLRKVVVAAIVNMASE
jgi:hypothetical protein